MLNLIMRKCSSLPNGIGRTRKWRALCVICTVRGSPCNMQRWRAPSEIAPDASPTHSRARELHATSILALITRAHFAKPTLLCFLSTSQPTPSPPSFLPPKIYESSLDDMKNGMKKICIAVVRIDKALRHRHSLRRSNSNSNDMKRCRKLSFGQR